MRTLANFISKTLFCDGSAIVAEHFSQRLVRDTLESHFRLDMAFNFNCCRLVEGFFKFVSFFIVVARHYRLLLWLENCEWLLVSIPHEGD